MSLFPPQPPRRTAAYRSSPAVTIRWAMPRDLQRLEVLAELDEATVPPAPLLLAFADEELWVAFSPRTGAVISDPFRPCADVADLVRERSRQLAVSDPRPPLVGALRLRRDGAAARASHPPPASRASTASGG